MENTVPTEINETYLKTIKYQNLSEELKKLGVGSAFRAGKKKDDIIADALKALKIVKDLKKDGVESEVEIEAKLSLVKEEEIKNEQAEALKEELVKQTLEKKSLEKTKKKELSKEVLEKNLANIDANLSMNIQGQRLVLLQKRKEIQAILKDM